MEVFLASAVVFVLAVLGMSIGTIGKLFANFSLNRRGYQAMIGIGDRGSELVLKYRSGIYRVNIFYEFDHRFFGKVQPHPQVFFAFSPVDRQYTVRRD